jgi:hypothetical protein
VVAAAALAVPSVRRVLTARHEDEATPHDAHWTVQVEVVLLSSRPGGGLGFRVLSAALPAGAHPDETALALAGFHTHHVAAHGARHLAYLAETDPSVVAASAAAPELWSALAAAVDRLPVAEHERAHALARQWGPDVGVGAWEH